jgi:hypothetical protein
MCSSSSSSSSLLYPTCLETSHQIVAGRFVRPSSFPSDPVISCDNEEDEDGVLGRRLSKDSVDIAQYVYPATSPSVMLVILLGGDSPCASCVVLSEIPPSYVFDYQHYRFQLRPASMYLCRS